MCLWPPPPRRHLSLSSFFAAQAYAPHHPSLSFCLRARGPLPRTRLAPPAHPPARSCPTCHPTACWPTQPRAACCWRCSPARQMPRRRLRRSGRQRRPPHWRRLRAGGMMTWRRMTSARARWRRRLPAWLHTPLRSLWVSLWARRCHARSCHGMWEETRFFSDAEALAARFLALCAVPSPAVLVCNIGAAGSRRPLLPLHLHPPPQARCRTSSMPTCIGRRALMAWEPWAQSPPARSSLLPWRRARQAQQAHRARQPRRSGDSSQSCAWCTLCPASRTSC